MKKIKMRDYIELGYYDEESLKANTFSLKRFFAATLVAIMGVCSTPSAAIDGDVVFDKLAAAPLGYVGPSRSLYDDEIEHSSYDYDWYMKDAKENGLGSWGSDHLLKNVIGPIDEIKLGPEDTIDKISRYVCYLRYGGISGEEDWKERRKYVEVLYQIVDERCKKIKDFDMRTKRWTLKRSEATGEERRLNFANRKLDFRSIADQNGAVQIACASNDTLCGLRLILKYLLEHDPNEIADEVMLELYPPKTRNQGLAKELFDLRVEQYTKKKEIRL